MILYLIIGLAFAGLTKQLCEEMYPGHVVDAYNGFCYVYQGPMYWEDGEALCQRYGGHLPSVHSDADNEWLFNFVYGTAGGTQRYWLGYFDTTHEGEFAWADGSPKDYDAWSPGEPNNSGDEDYTEGNWNSNKEWNDIPNYYNREVVCQIMPENIPPVTTPIDCESAFPGYNVQTRENWCYVDIQQTLLWPDAEAACVAIGGHLPSVHSDAENAWLDATFSNIWLGGYEPAENQGWYWSDGSEWGYVHWGPGEPNDAQGREDNIELYNGGNWNDIYDWVSKPTVCQVMVCTNYEGGYQAGVKQCGFDDEHFQSEDQTDGIQNIDDILEEMETEFEDEAAMWKGQVLDAFDYKLDMHAAVVDAQTHYENMMTARTAQEGMYNTARELEEAAHVALKAAVVKFNAAVAAYKTKHAEYVEKIDFLNYELFIIQQIRELLGSKIGYSPVQVILEVLPYDAIHDDWKTSYENIMKSAFNHESQRFRRRKRMGKRMGKRRHAAQRDAVKRPGPAAQKRRPPAAQMRRRRRRRR